MIVFNVASVMDLAGRNAVVTGGGSGIGRAAVLALAAAGAAVVAVDSVAEAAAETASRADGLRGSVTALTVDVSDHTAVHTALSGRAFHIVVSGAGILIRKTLDETSLDDWNSVLAVNQTGYFNLLKAVVPSMSDGGSIILIASHTGQAGYRYPAYTATKGAIIALGRQLARELGPRRIRVNTISPGVIVTDLTRARFTQPEYSEPVVSQTPLGRLGEPDDVAKAVLFFASELSEHVDGTDLLVDGGMTSTMYF